MSRAYFSSPDPNLFTEEEIATLVHKFYAKARKDPLLGPIFEAHVTDWDAHFIQMINFWSAQLRGTSRFHGAPMPKHIVIPDLSANLFQRWLILFQQTTQEIGNSTLEQQANRTATFIANRLWYGYQINHFPNKEPMELPAV